MAYNSIDELVNRYEKGVFLFEKPWEYSFEKECETNGYNKKGVFERYFIYKSISQLIHDHPDKNMWKEFNTYNNDKKNEVMEEAFENALKITVDKYPSSYPDRVVFSKRSFDIYGDIPDCDGSGGDGKLAIDLYEKLWKRKEGACVGNYFLELNNSTFGKNRFGGDTMNSAQTTMDILLKSIVPLNSVYSKSLHGQYSANFYIQLYAKYRELLVKDLEKINGLKSFLGSYHTLGNFVLVPAGFNKDRYNNTSDFWDSSLVWLKKFGYKSEKTDFSNTDFEKYINYFFLWDYVDGSDNKGKYKIKKLFNSHYKIEEGDDFEKTKANWTSLSADNKDEAEQFLKNAVNFINSRGKFMTAMLMIQTKNPDLYCDIQTFLTKEEFRAESISNAAKQILENPDIGKKIPENATNLLDELEKGIV